MTSDQLRELIAAAEHTLAERAELESAAQAVTAAIQAYATAAGVTVLQAWRALAPEGVAVPDDPEPEPLPTAPDWVAPTGAHDAYNAGDLVTFQGKVYRSRINANTWSPAAYPQGWEEYQ